MTSKAKAAVDIQGMEFDWLACDLDGAVAMFSTAGVGYAPREFLLDTDAHDRAIQVVISGPRTTEARFYPRVGIGLVNTWRLIAERGFFAYDCDPNGGPYRLVAAPVLPVRAEALPREVAVVAARVVCQTHFGRQELLSDELLGNASS